MVPERELILDLTVDLASYFGHLKKKSVGDNYH